MSLSAVTLYSDVSIAINNNNNNNKTPHIWCAETFMLSFVSVECVKEI